MIWVIETKRAWTMVLDNRIIFAKATVSPIYESLDRGFKKG